MRLTVEPILHWDPAFSSLVTESRRLPGVPEGESRRFRTWVDWMTDRLRHLEMSALGGWQDGGPVALAGYQWPGEIVRVHYLYVLRELGAAGVRDFLLAAEPHWSAASRIVIEGGPQTFLDELLGAQGFFDAGYQRFERARFERVLSSASEAAAQEGVSMLPVEEERTLLRLQAEGYTGGPDFLLIDDPVAMVDELLGDPWFEPDLSYAIRHEGEVVAALYTLRKGPVAWIASLCVHPSARGQGLARRLMLHAMSAYRAAGFQRVGLNVTMGNEPAVRLYRHMGFESSARVSLLYVKEQPQPGGPAG